MAEMTEEELWQEYKANKKFEIRERLIIKYAPLVKYIAGRIAINTPPQVEFDDLVSFGILGLIDAIEKYDPKTGANFKTYATVRIKGAIIDEIRLLDWIPRSLRHKAKQLEEAYATLENKYNRPATDEEIAEYLKLNQEELSKLISDVSGLSLVSLDDIWCTNGEKEEVTIGDRLVNPSNQEPDVLLEMSEAKRLLMEAIDRLPQREKEIVVLYYYEELTLKEIGKVLNVTESRVSQLHTKTLIRLRAYLNKMKEIFVE